MFFLSNGFHSTHTSGPIIEQKTARGLPPFRILSAAKFKQFYVNNGFLVVQGGIYYSSSIKIRRGILSLIPQKDRDLRYLKSWRPVSLLATDYKILAKALAIKLQEEDVL